jgi:hypothetical protein
MKKILSICIAALLSAGIYASPARFPDSSVKIQKVFLQNFPEVSYFKIYPAGNNYMVYFKESENESSGRVYYDADGNIVQSYRYYSGKELSPFIRAKIGKKYQGENITNVTEVTNDQEHYYEIILKDGKNMFIIDSDTEGNLQLVKKYKLA